MTAGNDPDVLFEEIADSFGTPTYVYDLRAVRRRAALLREQLPEALLHYAVKANPNGALLKDLVGRGLGAEVITLGELERALLAGFPADRLLVGGPGQDEPLIGRATAVRVGWVSLDSHSEWQLWRHLKQPGTRFLVRINPQFDPLTHPHLATGAATSKFGLPLDEAVELANEVAHDGVLAGFHLHVGSQITSMDVYEQVIAVAEAALAARPGTEMLNLGGGFAVPDFPLRQFALLARDMVRRQGLGLILEPGRFLVADSGVLLTRVRHVKSGPVRHLIVDAGMADLLRPALYGASHPVRRLGGPHGGQPADLDGPLCENADRLGQQVELPDDVQRGDLLVVERAGAYGMAMASNYASSLRPAEVVIDDEGYRLTRRRESVADLISAELP